MLLDRLFRPRATVSAGRALYSHAVAQARTPALYSDLGVPDTAEGRFETYSLHIVLLLDRMRGHSEAATEVSQRLFDAYVSDLDHALRELGVGDLSVGRRMRKLGEAFYGRCKSYEAAFAALPEPEALKALLVRTVYADVATPPVDRLMAYVLDQRAALAAQPLEPILAGQVTWKPL